MKRLALVTALALGMAALVGVSQAQDKAKYTISEVMLKGHKSGLCGKVVSGKASEAEKKELVEYYESLVLLKPGKGDAAEFKKKAEDMLKAAKGCAAGDKDSPATLKKLLNCAECHKVYK